MEKFEPEIELCCLSGAEDVAGLSLLASFADPVRPRHVLVDCGRRPDDAVSEGEAKSDVAGGTDDKGGLVKRLLERLDGAGLDAIVITHAHTDRIGGLAAIHAEMPHVPIYATAPSRAFVAQMWLGTSAPDPVAVEMMVGAMVPLAFGQRVLATDGLALTCYPAGHVMGASSLLLESRSGHLLVTGDITITDQKTVPGMMLPVATLRPDVVVVEATYGGKLYASRAAEELLLVRQVAEILERGGRVLFPCLALGRGQEVLAILGQAMEQQTLPTVPVWADGKICDICDEYGRFPSWMTSWLRERMRRHDHPFFTGSVRAVPEGQGWPEAVAPDESSDAPSPAADHDEAPGAAIVVTSRDVNGKHSLAPLIEAIADDPGSCLMLSHYDDEESLAEAWENAAREGQWQGRGLQCQVASYKLSQHADTAQVVGAIDRMRPKQIVVVQGTDKAQVATVGAFERAGAAGVCRLGDAAPQRFQGVARDVSVTVGPRGAKSAEQRGRLEFDDIPALVEILKAMERPEKLFSVQEVLLAWGDVEGADDPREQERVSRFLGARRSLLRRDHKRNHLFRLRDDAGPGTSRKGKAASPSSGSPELPLDMFNALKAVDAVLTERNGLYKRSAHQDEKRIQLSFYFPKIAARAHADAIGQLAERTGWSVELRETPHQAALVDAATRLMPRSWALKKQPSIHLHEDKVVVQPEEIPPLQKAQQVAQAFAEETGFRLEFKGLSLGASPAAASNGDEAGAAPARASSGDASRDEAPESRGQESQDGSFVPAVPAGPVADEPWEINKAYQLIRSAFADCPQPLQKVGLKGNTIEVSFISTQVGQRYEGALAELSQRIGWSIQIKDRADQHRIKAAAKELLAPWEVKKEPGFHPHSGEVHVTCGSLPTADELAELNASFERDTGFQLKVKAML